jgi:hypothetical protein
MLYITTRLSGNTFTLLPVESVRRPSSPASRTSPMGGRGWLAWPTPPASPTLYRPAHRTLSACSSQPRPTTATASGSVADPDPPDPPDPRVFGPPGSGSTGFTCFWASWIRIYRIQVFLGLLDPDPPDSRVFGPPGSGSGSISQGYGSRSGSFYH